MAIKPTTTTRKRKSSSKVLDLPAKRNPKGGAQKKEGPALMGGTHRGTNTRTTKTRLS